MKNWNDYKCDGQLSIWDLYKAEKPVVDPDDSVCEGCKWRNYHGRKLEVNDLGDTWVYCCPGTACANWRHGTPLNLSFHDIGEELEEDHIYCFNREFLPELENLVPMIEAEFDIRLKRREFDGNAEYYYKYKQSEFYIHDSTYLTDGKRFVSFSLNSAKEGCGKPCDNLTEVLEAFRRGFRRLEEKRKKDKIAQVEIKGICDDPYCSNCNYNLYGEESEEYCPSCGAKLDWSRYLAQEEENG